jgi:hypothetical protein
MEHEGTLSRSQKSNSVPCPDTIKSRQHVHSIITFEIHWILSDSLIMSFDYPLIFVNLYVADHSHCEYEIYSFPDKETVVTHWHKIMTFLMPLT